MKMRIQETVKILSNFKEMRDPEKSRVEYMDELKEDLCQAFGYNNEMIELFMQLFPPAACFAFIEANETHRPVTIRTNTLRAKRRDLAKTLIQRGVNLDPVAQWSKVGLKIFESTVPIGATPEYLAGHYILQSPSSFLPVMALCPQPKERILDMAAAPGGKTTYIGQLMKNQGVLFANDIKKERLKSLTANIQRLGISNAVVTNHDGRNYPKIMTGFDRVLLDAPCTGLGVISRDPSIKGQKTVAEIRKMAHLQKELLLAAIDCVDAHSKTGGYIVYSTCSVAVEENEWVVDYCLSKRYVKIVETGIDVGEAGLPKYKEHRFHPSIKNTRRIYPHTHNMDGFYFAKIKKYANGEKSSNSDGDAIQMKQKENKKKRDVKAAKKVENAKKKEEEAEAKKNSTEDSKKKRKRRGKKKNKGEKKEGETTEAKTTEEKPAEAKTTEEKPFEAKPVAEKKPVEKKEEAPKSKQAGTKRPAGKNNKKGKKQQKRPKSKE